MVDDDDGESRGEAELEPRPPGEGDLVELCRALNESGSKYMIIGGFAMIQAGYPRFTGNLDILMDVSPANEARIFEALRTLPDKAVDELDPGDVSKYLVVRVADEIVVDLMKSASGIEYEEASREVVIRKVCDVEIPFASPRLLWRMKKSTHREKDAGDLVFLRKWFEARGETPP